MSAAEPDVVDGAAIKAMTCKIARATADKNGTTDTNVALHALMHALAVLTIHSCPANAEFIAMREVEQRFHEVAMSVLEQHFEQLGTGMPQSESEADDGA